MHFTERDEKIHKLLSVQNFVSLRELCEKLDASPATIRRDLERLEGLGQLLRVHGGARAADTAVNHLEGTPFDANLQRNIERKISIGRAAAKLCSAGDAIIIDGGTTTFQMCPFLEQKKLQVLTNSLHIVEALLPTKVQLSIPGGSIFREQNIILSPFEDDGLNRYHAGKMFMGAAAISTKGLMQIDSVLIQAERKLMARADALIVLVDSSKFRAAAGQLLCNLNEVDMVITDSELSRADRAMLKKANVEVLIA